MACFRLPTLPTLSQNGVVIGPAGKDTFDE